MVSQALNANYSIGSDPDQRLARNLGWFSIGLGATEIFAPGLVARISGAPDSKRSRTVIRTYGGREIAQGIAILSSMPRPAGWMWGRVAGDVLYRVPSATEPISRQLPAGPSGDDVAPWGHRHRPRAGSVSFAKSGLTSVCENSNPNAWIAETAAGPPDLGRVRLFAYARRLCRRAGGVRSRALRGRGPAQSARAPARRAGAVPVRHLPDRLHGRGDVQHPARRHDRGMGLRPGRAVRDEERVPAGRRARDRRSTGSTTGCRWRADKVGRRDDQLRRDERSRGAEGDDRRARAGRMHRRGRDGGARARADVRLRPRQAGGDAGDRPPDRAARGDPGLPQRRHRVGHRRVWRVHRQVPDGPAHEPLADDPHRAVPRAPLHEAAARARSRRGKSTRASSSRIACRSKTRRKATRCSATSKTTARRSCSNRSSVRSTRQLHGRAVHARPG